MNSITFTKWNFKRAVIVLTCLFLTSTATKLFAQPTSVSVAQGGVVTGAYILSKNTATNGQTGGTWSNLGSLNVEYDVGSNGTYHIFSGFTSSGHTITWTKGGVSYQFYLTIQTGLSKPVRSIVCTKNPSETNFTSCVNENLFFQVNGSGGVAVHQVLYFVNKAGGMEYFAAGGDGVPTTLAYSYSPTNGIQQFKAVVVHNVGGNSYFWDADGMITFSGTDNIPHFNIAVDGGTSVCMSPPHPGYTLRITPPMTDPTLTYQWYQGSVSTPISGATNQFYNVPSGTYGSFFVMISGCGTPKASNTITIKNTPLPPVGIAPPSAMICGTQSVTLTATGTNLSNPAIWYDWYRNSSPIFMNDNVGAYLATTIGNYKVRAFEEVNPSCYVESPNAVVSQVAISEIITFMEETGIKTFCQTITPQLRIQILGNPINTPLAVHIDIINPANNNVVDTRVVSPILAGAPATLHSMPPISDSRIYRINKIVISGSSCEYIPTGVHQEVYTKTTLPPCDIIGSNFCENSPISIGLTNAAPGVTYTVQNASNAVIGTYTPGISGHIPNAFMFASLAQGTYSVYASYTGCANELIGTFTIVAQPIIQTVTPPLCQNKEDLIINGSQTGVTYSLWWHNGFAFQIVGTPQPGTGAPINFGPINLIGNFKVEAATANGCIVELETFTIDPNPTVGQLLTNAYEYCQGTPSHIQFYLGHVDAGNFYSLLHEDAMGNWVEFMPGIQATTTGGPWTPTQWYGVPGGVYTVRVCTPKGCCFDNPWPVTIVERPLPTAIISANPHTFCSSTPVPLNIIEIVLSSYNSDVSFKLSDDKGNSTVINNYYPSSYTFPRNVLGQPAVLNPPTVTTTYTVSDVTDGVCTGVGSSVTITIVPSPVVSLVGPTEICEGDDAIFTVVHSTPPAPGSYSYKWSTGETTQSITVSPGSSMQYHVIVTDNTNGCETTLIHNITLNPLPIVSFTGLKPDYCTNHPPDLMVGTPPGGQFYFVDDFFGGNPVPLGTDQFDPDLYGAGTYYIQYHFTDTNGCTGKSTIFRTVVAAHPYVWIDNLVDPICRDSDPITFYGRPPCDNISLCYFTVTSNGSHLSYDATVPGQITIVPTLSHANTTYTIEYTYTDGNGCLGWATAQFTIIDVDGGTLDIKMFNPQPHIEHKREFCPSDNTNYEVVGYVFGSVAGSGYFTGFGVIDSGLDIGEAIFNPTLVPQGQYGIPFDITYHYTSPEGCVGATSIEVVVGVQIESNILPSYCEDDAVVTICTTPAAGGRYYIYAPGDFPLNPPSNSYIGNCFVLDPAVLAAANQGDWTVQYVYTWKPGTPDECIFTREWTVAITQKRSALFTGYKTNYCPTDPPSLLIPTFASIALGDFWVFSGTGVSGNYFVPSLVPPALHGTTINIILTVTTKYGCVDIETVPVTVNPIPDLWFTNLPDQICSNEPVFTFSTNIQYTSGPGTHTFTCYESSTLLQPMTWTPNDAFATFDPSVGPGNYMVIYTFIPDPVTGISCPVRLQKWIEILHVDNVNFILNDYDYCQDSDDLLIIGSPPGGTFSIFGFTAPDPKITDHGNGTATLHFSQMPLGNYDVCYEFVNVNDCEANICKPIWIHPFPTAFRVEGGGCYCLGGAGVEITLSSSQLGYSYQLLLNGMNIGTPLIGTDFQISFGLQTLAGNYTVLATASGPKGCQAMMIGSVDVSISDLYLDYPPAVMAGCFGETNGTAKVEALGGCGPYTFMWEKNIGGTWTNINQPTPQAWGLGAGEYQVTVNDIGANPSCQKISNPIIITENPDFNVAAIINVVDVKCFGEQTGCFTVTMTPQHGNYEFSIDHGVTWQDNATFCGLGFGTYWVSIKDVNGDCEKIDVIDVQINQPIDKLKINLVNISDVICHGQENGEIEILVTGGTPPYTYQWFRDTTPPQVIGALNGNFTHHVFNLPAGDYYVVVTDHNGIQGCVTQASFTINEPDDWDIYKAWFNCTAAGLCDGSINTYVQNGQNPPYTMVLEKILPTPEPPDPGGGPTWPALCAGTYKVTYTDALGCTTTEIFVITEPGDLVVGDIVRDVSCPDRCDGAITINIQTGNPPYDVELYELTFMGQVLIYDDIQTNLNSHSVSNLCTGVYYWKVIDSTGNPKVGYPTIYDPGLFQIVNPQVTHISCHGAGDGAISYQINTSRPPADIALYDVTWSGPNFNDSGTLGDPTNPTNPMSNQTGLVTPGLYQLVIEYEGFNNAKCQLPYTFIPMLDEPDPLVIIPTITHVTCNGGCDGKITIEMQGRPHGTHFTYQWEEYDGATSSWLLLPETTFVLQGICVGRYRVTVETQSNQAGIMCSAQDEFTINQPNPMILTAIPRHITTCFGDPSGIVELSVVGGIPPYDIAGSHFFLGWNGNPITITNLPAGDHMFIVTDASGCTVSSGIVTINQPDRFEMNNFIAYIDCEVPYSGCFEFDLIGGRENDLGQYIYSIVVYDNNTGLSPYNTILPVTLPVPPGGHHHTICGLPEGSYILVIKDVVSSNGDMCPIVEDFIDLEHIKIIEDLTVHPTCPGKCNGRIMLSITGAIKPVFNWTKASDPMWSSPFLNQMSLCADTYTLTLTDQGRNNCQLTRTFTLHYEYDLRVDAFPSDITCFGENDGKITIINVEGYSALPLSYKWEGGDIGPPPSSICCVTELQNRGPGVYNLTVTDRNGCEITESYTINEPLPITFTLSQELESCDPYGRKITVNNLQGGTIGNTSNYTYYWTAPTGVHPVQSQDFQTGMPGGTYSVTVGDDNKCSTTESITLNYQIELDEKIEYLKCHGNQNASITLKPQYGSGKYSYFWTTSNGTGLVPTAKDQSLLGAGTYTVVVTDLEEFVLDAMGNPVYCTVTKDYTIDDPDKIIVTGAETHVLCYGDQDGTINIFVQGGTPPYTFLWSSINGSGIIPTNQNQTGLSGGIYTVVVTDVNGCTGTRVFTVDEKAPLNFDFDVTDTDCLGNNMLDLINISGGSGTYDFIWGGPPGGPAGSGIPTPQTNIPGGIYTVTMVDTDPALQGNCILTKSTTLTKEFDVDFDFTNETCAGSLNGTITLTPIDGLMPYTYVWTTISGSGITQGEKNQSGLAAGQYDVVVTDARGCSKLLSITVGVQYTLVPNPEIVHVTCYGENTGSINMLVSGGVTNNYDFIWTYPGNIVQPITSNPLINNLFAGTYEVVIINYDLNGDPICSIPRSYPITQPAADISITDVKITDVLCHGDATGAISITVAGGDPLTYSFSWTGTGAIPFPNQQNISGLTEGDYFVTITYSNSCPTGPFGPFTVVQPAAPLNVTLISTTNVTTVGGNNGDATIQITGGTGSYTISWYLNPSITPLPAPPYNSVYAGNLVAGVYKVEVEDQNGCKFILDNIIIDEPGQPLDMQITKTHVGPCNKADNGTIRITAQGGWTPYQSIELTRGATLMTPTQTGLNFAQYENLPAGTYNAIVTDDMGEKKPYNVIITEPPLLTIAETGKTHINCRETWTGDITVNIGGGLPRASDSRYRLILTGGPAGTDQDLTVPAGSRTFSGLPAGTYRIIVVDDSNVKQISGPGATVGPNISLTDGYGDNTGMNTDFDMSTGCWKDIFVTLIQPEYIFTLELDNPLNNTLCFGEFPFLKITTNWDFATLGNLEFELNDGQIYTIPSSPHTFYPNGTPVGTPPNVGFHTYFIREIFTPSTSPRCLKGIPEGTVTIEIKDRPTATLSGTKRICQGEVTDISVSLTGQGPWEIVIVSSADGTTQTISGITTSPHIVTVLPNVTTTYTLFSVEDANCTGNVSGSTIVNVDPLVSVELKPPVPAQICAGDATYIRFYINYDPASNNGPWLIDYTKTEAGSAPEALSTPPINRGNLSTDLIGTYYQLTIPGLTVNTTYTITNILDYNNFSGSVKNCNGIILGTPVTINVRPYPEQALPIDGPDEVCQGQIYCFQVPAILHAVDYVWTIPATGYTIVSGQGTSNICIKFEDNALDGYITVQGRNDCGLGGASSILVTVAKLPQLPGVISGPVAMCQGSPNVFYTVQPQGLNAGWYNWTVPAGMQIVGSPPYGSSIEVMINPATSALTGMITVQAENDCGLSPQILELPINVYANPIVDPGLDQTSGCNVTATLDATILNTTPSETGLWTVNTTAIITQVTNPKSPVNNLVRGDNIFTWTVTNIHGCSASADVNIRNNTLMVQANASPTLVCDGISNLTGTEIPNYPGNLTGMWEKIPPTSTAAIDNAFSNETTIRNLEPGNNQVIWVITQNGCRSQSNVVTIRNDQVTQAQISGIKTIPICDEPDVVLTANIPEPNKGTGQWSFVAGNATILPNFNSNVITVSNFLTDVIILKWTITKDGCSSSDTVTIYYNKLDVSAGSDFMTCHACVTLDGTPPPPGVGGYWTDPSNYGVNFIAPTQYNTDVCNLKFGTNQFVWTLTKNSCPSSASVTIISDRPSPAILPQEVIQVCDFTATLEAMPLTHGDGLWTLESGMGVITDPTDNVTTVTGLDYGVNKFRWTSYTASCDTFAILTIINNKIPVFAGFDRAVCESNGIPISGTPIPPGYTGLWTQENVPGGAGHATIINFNIADTQIDGMDFGTMGFIWTLTHTETNCKSSATVYITNDTPHPVYAGPTQTVTPNWTQMQATPVTNGIGTWGKIQGTSNLNPLGDFNNPYADVENLSFGANIWRWTVETTHCSDYDDVVIIRSGGEPPNAGRDDTTCDGTYKLSANTVNYAQGRWSLTSGAGNFDDIYDPNTTVRYLAEGDNEITWCFYYTETISECHTITITNNNPGVPKAGDDDFICQDAGDSYTFSWAQAPVISGVDVKWEVVSGTGTFANPNIVNATVNGMMQGENKYRYVLYKGENNKYCERADTVRIFNGRPDVPYAGEDETICQNEHKLRPNYPTQNTIDWTVAEWEQYQGYAQQHQDDPNMWTFTPGETKLVWHFSTWDMGVKRCFLTDTIKITNHTPSPATISGPDDICGTEVTLNAGAVTHGSGKWTLVKGGGVFDCDTCESVNITGLLRDHNEFRWCVSNFDCPPVCTTKIVNNNQMIVNAGEDIVTCQDTVLLAATNPSPGTGQWGIVLGTAQFGDATDANTYVTDYQSGETILFWEVMKKGCPSRDTISIFNNMPTPAYAGEDNWDVCSKEYTLSANTPLIGTGQWHLREGGGDFPPGGEFLPTVTVTNLPEGRVSIFDWEITNEGCISVDRVHIESTLISANAGPDRIICDDNVILAANTPSSGTGEWTGSGAQFEDFTSPTTRAYNIERGKQTLTWTITNKTCKNSSEVEIYNASTSTANAGGDDFTCFDEYVLDATMPAYAQFYKWSVVSGYGEFDDDTDPKTTVRKMGQGSNQFRWTLENKVDSITCTDFANVIIINGNPSDAYAGRGYPDFCGDALKLNAVAPDYGEGRWGFVQGDGFFDDWEDPKTYVRDLAPGENILRWTVHVNERCHKYDDISIMNNTPSKADAGPDIDDCLDYATMDADRPEVGVGTWALLSGGGTFENVHDPKTKVTGLRAGKNEFSWTVEKGQCSSIDIIEVLNNNPAVAKAGDDQTICRDYTTLNANIPDIGSGEWRLLKGEGTFDDFTNPKTKVTDVGFGENIYRWVTIYGSCESTDDVIVTSHFPHVDAGEDQIVHKDETFLNANNPGILDAQWEVVGKSEAYFIDPTYYNTKVVNLSPGMNTFKWVIKVLDCEVYDMVSIEYREIPEVYFIADKYEGCVPLTVIFTNHSVSNKTLTYHWDFGDGNSSGDTNPTHTFEEPGLFNVMLRAPGPDGHDGIYTAEVDVWSRPIADFSVRSEVIYIPDDKAVFFDRSKDAVTWLWEFGDREKSISLEQNPTFEYKDEGIYDVTLYVTNEYTCSDSITKSRAIEALLQGFIEFPNAFMPRPGDSGYQPSSEHTLVFKPVYKDVDKESFVMQIFARWGQLIYETRDIDEGWNGYYEGQLSGQAVYTFTATGRYISGKEFRKSGSFMLVR